MKSAIIGVGNKLMGDEGVGVHAVEYLRGQSPFLRGTVPLLDAGTGGMALFHLLEKYERVIIIDAADFGGSPGEVRRFEMDKIKLAPDSAQVSLHGTSLAGILQLADKLGARMPKITIVAIQPLNIAPSLLLSPECQKALESLKDFLFFVD